MIPDEYIQALIFLARKAFENNDKETVERLIKFIASILILNAMEELNICHLKTIRIN
jgi:hypothetical protein